MEPLAAPQATFGGEFLHTSIPAIFETRCHPRKEA